METKFNFNSQICSTSEQSERLLALGLKKETADMTWFRRSKNADWESSTISYKEWVEEILPIFNGYTLEDIIPAWSLHRLWEIGKFMGINLSSEVSISNLYKYAIARIEQQIKKEYFNKEYLV